MDNNGTRIGFVITRSRRRRSNPQLHMYFLDCHENLRFSRNDKCMCHAEFISTTVPNNFIKKYLKYNTIKNLEFNKLCPDNNLHI